MVHRQILAKFHQSLARQGRNPALELVDGLLVFNGEIEAAEVDLLRVIRDERDQDIAEKPIQQSNGLQSSACL